MKLTKEQHILLIEWINDNFIQINSFNDVKTSYGIQYLFEISDYGFYVDNDTIKQAMLECGFKVQNKKAENWVFNISMKSPAIKKFFHGSN